MRPKSHRLFAAAAVLLAHCPDSASALLTPPPAIPILLQKHPVALGSGRALNLVCTGHGTPTIVFESGLGANLLTWQKIADPVADLSRSCFYDRAGYGYSDPPGRPSTAANAVQDLHTLLRQAKVDTPVVLVGHSIGGLYATLYADRYPRDVAGLVLIDPAFAAQDRDETPAERATDETAFAANLAQLRACAALARAGKLASEAHPECFAFAPNRMPVEKAFLSWQMVRPHRYEAMASESESQHSADGASDINTRAETAADHSLGNTPLIVLTAAQTPDEHATPGQRAAATRLWQSWKAGHDRLAARSTRGRSLVVADTGHFIQIDQPRAVIAAIADVVGTISDAAGWPSSPSGGGVGQADGGGATTRAPASPARNTQRPSLLHRG